MRHLLYPGQPSTLRVFGPSGRSFPALATRFIADVHRSQLVNVTSIDRVEPWFSGSLKVRLRGGPEIEFSRRQAQIFRERTGL